MKSTIKLFSNPTTEAQHQCNVIRWSLINRARFPELALLHHVPNGGTRDKVEAAHLKQCGVKPGVPDLDLPVPRGPYHGLRIEMKALDGKESPDQIWWRVQLTKQGYCAEVCYGWQNAVALIEQYMLLDGVKLRPDERCVCCGEYVTEGSMVCGKCFKNAAR